MTAKAQSQIQKDVYKILKHEAQELSFQELDDLLWAAEKDYYEERPVVIDTFITDKDFLRKSFWGEKEDLAGFNPWWSVHLNKIYPCALHSPYYESIGYLPIGGGKCGIKGTLISTDKGILPIEEIHSRYQSGELIQVISEEGCRNVIDTLYDGEKKVITITTHCGRELFFTHNHQFRVLENGNIIWVKFKDVRNGDNLIVSRSDHPFPKKSIEDGYAYFLGVMLGDGGISNSKWFLKDGSSRQSRGKFSLTLGKDTFLQEKEFVLEVEKGFRCYVGKVEWKVKDNRADLLKGNLPFSLELKEDRFYEENEDGSYTKRVPFSVMQGSRDDIVEFFAGLIDTDGHVSEKSIEIVSKFKDLVVKDLVALCSALGLRFKVSEKYNKRYCKMYYRLNINGQSSFKKLQSYGLKLRISYKKKAFELLANKIHNRNNRDILDKSLKGRIKGVYERASKNRGGSIEFARGRNKSMWGGVWGRPQNFSLQTLKKIQALLPVEFNEDEVLVYLVENDCYLDKVVSVEEQPGEHPVYDLTVEGSPTYYVDGLISHNTTTALVSIVYEIYKLLCLKNPQTFYQLRPKGVKISFTLFSLSLSLADDVNWQVLESLIQNAPWFERKGILQGAHVKLKTKTTVPIYKNIVVDLGSGAVHALGKAVWGGCFTGDTMIPLLDGREVRFDDLVDDIFPKEKGTVYIHSYDNRRKEFVPGRIKNAFCTGINDIYRIHLNTGKYFDMTPDQGILCRDNKYRDLRDLEVGQALLPTKFRKKMGYRTFADPFTGEEQTVHRLVAQWKSGHLVDGRIVHHANLNKIDNTPENLRVITAQQHFDYHKRTTLNGKWWEALKRLDPVRYKILSGNIKKEHENWLKTLTKEELINFRKKVSRVGLEAQRKKRLSDPDWWKARNRKLSISASKARLGNENLARISRENLEKVKEWRISQENAENLQMARELFRSNPEAVERSLSGWRKYHATEEGKLVQAKVMSEAISGYSSGLTKEQRSGHVKKGHRTRMLKKGYSLLQQKGNVSLNYFSKKMRTSITKYFGTFKNYQDAVYVYNCKIIKIEYRGKQKTYDLTIDHESHNFMLSAGVLASNCLDEANFQRKQSQQAYKSYNTILRRMESRFLEKSGRIPGILWLVSSPSDGTDFLSRRIMEGKSAKRTYVVPFSPIWDIQAYRKDVLYSDETFPVYIGGDKRDPFLITKDVDITNLEPELIYNPPIEFQESFEKDIIEAIKDIIGKTTADSSKLFRSVESIDKTMILPHRFKKEVIEIDFADPTDKIEDYVESIAYFKNPLYPEAYRFIHMDLAYKRDKAALSACYALIEEKHVRIEPDNPLTEAVEFYPRSERNFFIDWLLVIKAKKGQEIPIYKIRNWIQFLRDMRYPIRIFSADQFQSRQMLQDVKLMHIETKNLSLDKEISRDYWINYRMAISSRRMSQPKHSLLKTELINLKDSGKKIDHSVESSKDAADAVVGSFISCYNSDVIYNPMLVKREVTNKTSREVLLEQVREHQSAEFASKFFGSRYESQY